MKKPKGKVVWNEGIAAVSPWFKIQVFHCIWHEEGATEELC